MDSPNTIIVSSFRSFDNVQKSVSHLRKKLEDFCQEEITVISGRGKVLDDVFSLRNRLKDKFGILQLKPCFKVVPDEIE